MISLCAILLLLGSFHHSVDGLNTTAGIQASTVEDGLDHSIDCDIRSTMNAEVNGDRYEDLVALLCQSDNTARLLMVAGRPAWTEQVDIYEDATWSIRIPRTWLSPEHEQLQVTDRDADGISNIELHTEEASYFWYGGRGFERKLSFSRADRIILNPSSIQPAEWAVTDLNSDPWPDFLALAYPPDAASGVYFAFHGRADDRRLVDLRDRMPNARLSANQVPEPGAMDQLQYDLLRSVFLPIVQNPGSENSPPKPAETPVVETPSLEQRHAFPELDPRLLGNCSAEIHDRYRSYAPNGLRYRSWHPSTVPIDLDDHAHGHCSFAHEHGDDRLVPGLNMQPHYGYAAHLFGDLEMIEDHGGYKTFAHSSEGLGRGSDAAWRISLHQGSADAGRLFRPMHEVQLEVLEPGFLLTRVHVMADTGKLSPTCGPQIGERLIPSLDCIDKAKYEEAWTYTLRVGDGSTRGKAAFFAQPTLRTRNGMTMMKRSHSSALIATSILREGLEMGHPRSWWLGNLHALEHPDFAWGNATGEFALWTDAEGRALAAERAAACTSATCIQQLIAVQDYIEPGEQADRIFEFSQEPLPLGAFGGN